MAKSLLLSVALFTLHARGDEEIDTAACTTMGFNEDLECSSCGKLAEFNLDELKTDCLGCCVGAENDDDQVVVKFPKARLDICN
eukprot:m.55466 g.55466  ORF g.55466 m.55466 type:complete len:84 (-) comp22074_c0_seq1:292-543(-)